MWELPKIRRVLTFFAHPDDETLGAGATIAKLTRLGVDVHIAIPATGIFSRRQTLSNDVLEKELATLREDCQRSLSVLGVPESQIYLGDFPDNEMDKRTLLEVIHFVEPIIQKMKPDLILTHHWRCTNIDHHYCHEAVVVATRPAVNSHIAVLCAEIPGSTGYLRPAHWEPNFHVEVSEEDLKKKIKAMEAYKGEARPDPHPRSPEVLRALAKVRGSESGFLFAEAFMIQKLFG